MSLLILGCTIAIQSCGLATEGDQGKRTHVDDHVMYFDAEDIDMNKAFLLARESYPKFISKLKEQDEKTYDFSVKLSVPFDNSREHIWFSDLHYKNDSLHGVVDNDVLYVQNMADGDTVFLDPYELSDWMYIENDTLRGGFTLSVAMQDMTDYEILQLQKSMGCVIPNIP